MRGDKGVVIVEEFIDFDYEITLLTVKQRASAIKRGPGTVYVEPIGHRQERGDYQESWMPCPMPKTMIRKAQRMAKKITDRIAGPEGAGIFGVEFFVRGDEVIFSELSPRPHDTGMVTMISQDLSQFELHLRAILGLPIPRITYRGPSASAVILADRASRESACVPRPPGCAWRNRHHDPTVRETGDPEVPEDGCRAGDGQPCQRGPSEGSRRRGEDLGPLMAGRSSPPNGSMRRLAEVGRTASATSRDSLRRRREPRAPQGLSNASPNQNPFSLPESSSEASREIEMLLASRR